FPPRRSSDLGQSFIGRPLPPWAAWASTGFASGPEALRSKVSLHVSPAAPRAQGKRVLAEKAGSAGLFRQAGAAASRFRYHVPAVRFAQRRTLPACKAAARKRGCPDFHV